jgi:hypothetical protein
VNGVRRLLVCADDVNILSESLLQASREVDLAITYMIIHQNAKQYHT